MNLSITTKPPPDGGVLGCKNRTIRERILRFLFGKRLPLTILVPGRVVSDVYIKEVNGQ